MLDGVFIPDDALRQLDLPTLAGLNAHAHELGRTSFAPEGIEIIDSGSEIKALAAFVLGEPDDPDKFGLDTVADDAWLFIVVILQELTGALRGRVLEVRASAFRALPVTELTPEQLDLMLTGAENYRAKRERNGIPLGTTLYPFWGES